MSEDQDAAALLRLLGGTSDLEGAGGELAQLYQRLYGTAPPPTRSRTPRGDIDLPSQPSMATSHPPEAAFQQWVQANRIDPRELDVYDFRSAMQAGAKRDASGHWPSEFKRENHPNLVVGGFNTKTGQRVPSAPLAGSVQELIRLGWAPEDAAQLWASVQK